MQSIETICIQEWPAKHLLKGPIKKYYPVFTELSVLDGLLLRGNRIIIPELLRDEVIKRLHTGHMGLTKTLDRAKAAVWWPGMSSQLKETVENCTVCSKERSNRAEPLIPTPLPSRPWQCVGTDISEWRGQSYLLVVDYLSRYPEIARLSDATSKVVIEHMKSFFPRHGIPEEVRSDNGPQYSSAAFAKFASEYEFSHITSSPLHPQSNGEAERMVRTVKSLLKKATDPYLALLAYRATPLANGFSPSELLMGRQIRSVVPKLPHVLHPRVLPWKEIQTKEAIGKEDQKRRFDKRHATKVLKPLSEGTTVWVRDRREPGKVLQDESTPRSYRVQTQSTTVRRNCSKKQATSSEHSTITT